jgi:regulatory protein
VSPTQGQPQRPLSISALCAGDGVPGSLLMPAEPALASLRSRRAITGLTDSPPEPQTPSQGQASPWSNAAGTRRGTQLSLKGRALRLLAGREHSRAELERKLSEHAQDAGELARILDDLQAKGFINEARVVESVIHRRSERLGSARIAHELRAKGLPPDAIAQAVGQLQASELDRAHALWSRKFGQAPAEPKEQARQMRFLLARGFSAEVVRKVLAQAD